MRYWAILLFRAGWGTLLGVSALIGILNLPSDVKNLPQAYGYTWVRLMPDQNTALIIFSTILVIWISWTEMRVLAREVWGIKRRSEAFERADGWSITFRASNSIQTLFSARLGDRAYALLLRGVSIQNLAKTHTRSLDFRLVVKFHGDINTITLIPSKDTRAAIHYPITLLPMESRVVDIEFGIEPEDREPFTPSFSRLMDFEDFELVLFEHFSGGTKQAYVGQTFDALKNTYRVRRSSESKEERLARRRRIAKG